MLELERVWLIKTMPTDLNQHDHAEISQHYLNLPGGGRLRKRRNFKRAGDQRVFKDMSFELTQKRELAPGDRKRRDENNVYLSEEAYLLLKPTIIRGLKKIRHVIPLSGGLLAELDVFSDELEGLTWVEVEFPSEESMNDFMPPDWFGREITEERWASSSWVAGRTYDDIKHLLT